jgi:peroxiredoxin Q/BCP
MALSKGDKAPDFKTNDQDGNTFKLSDHKGRKVVLYFYPRDMTPGCTAEACNLRDNYRQLQKAGYEVFGVSTDSEKSHQKFIAKQNLPFSLLADTDKSIHGKYGTWVEKSLYGRKYMGTARVTFVINEAGIIEEIIEKVDTKNHSAQILQNEKEKVKQDKKPAAKVAAKKKASAKVSRSRKDTRKK